MTIATEQACGRGEANEIGLKIKTNAKKSEPSETSKRPVANVAQSLSEPKEKSTQNGIEITRGKNGVRRGPVRTDFSQQNFWIPRKKTVRTGTAGDIMNSKGHLKPCRGEGRKATGVESEGTLDRGRQTRVVAGRRNRGLDRTFREESNGELEHRK